MRSFCFLLAALFSLTCCVAHAEPKSTGLILLNEEQYRSIPLAATPLLGNIPSEVDLSSFFPTPGNQGHQGSCVGWAIGYLKDYQERVERKWDLSTKDHLFSPAFIYNQIKSSTSCEGGSSYVDALNLLRKSGMATLADFPYSQSDCSRLPDAGINQHARNFAVADWRRVNVQDETEVKTQLASGFPVLIGMMVDDGFGQLAHDNIYYGPSGAARGGHAMVVVGYSDHRRAFRVINSWGADWGEGGFGWIDYAAFRSVVREAYVVQDIIITPPTPNPDPTPVTPSPQPTPAPVADAEVQLGIPSLIHNIQVATNTGVQSGMQIRVPGTIKNASGRSMQVVVKFNYLNGPPLRANIAEPNYRDTGGLVATGTQPTPIASDMVSTDTLPITIPYYALNFPPTGGNMIQNLSFTVIAFVDNQQKAQTQAIPFQFRW